MVALSIFMATLFGLPALGMPAAGTSGGIAGFRCAHHGILKFQELFPVAAGCCCWPI